MIGSTTGQAIRSKIFRFEGGSIVIIQMRSNDVMGMGAKEWRWSDEKEWRAIPADKRKKRSLK
jgi:putative lipase involved disintegration of autophagic bodies